MAGLITRCCNQNGEIIEVIGTDAGTPTSLPADHRDRLLQAGLVAAPQRLHGPLRELFGAALPPLLATDRIEACLETLQGCRPEQAVVVEEITVETERTVLFIFVIPCHLITRFHS